MSQKGNESPFEFVCRQNNSNSNSNAPEGLSIEGREEIESIRRNYVAIQQFQRGMERDHTSLPPIRSKSNNNLNLTEFSILLGKIRNTTLRLNSLTTSLEL